MDAAQLEQMMGDAPGRTPAASMISRMLSVTLVATAAFTAIGCTSGNATRPTGLRVTGTVREWPTCEVEREAQPCRPAPLSEVAVIAHYPHSATVLAATTTDKRGHFTVHLLSGVYVFQLRELGGYGSVGRTVTTVQGHARNHLAMLVRSPLAGG